MNLIQFCYEKDKNLTALKTICKNCNSNAVKKTFEYLRILFYFNRNKVFSEYIPDTCYYVASLGKGFIRLVDIAVVANYQKRGYGKYLMNRIINIAKANHINKITLRTSSEETAFMFYHKIGFKDVKMNGNDIEMEFNL